MAILLLLSEIKAEFVVSLSVVVAEITPLAKRYFQVGEARVHVKPLVSGLTPRASSSLELEREIGK
jgi:hypothetical protein